MRRALVILVALSATVVAVAAFADPPDHAPAYGWRNKHDRDHGHDEHARYRGYRGGEWDRDYGIRSGRCNREEVGAVLGGVVGGVVGSQVGSRDNRVVSTIIGAAVGALLGSRIGRSLDDGDRACMGHAFELGDPGRHVTWQNERTGVRYDLAPQGPSRLGAACRDFRLEASDGHNRESRGGTACQVRPGVWEVR